MGFFDIFFGSTQSQFTAYGILAAIVAICITILLTRTDMTMGNKLLLVFFVILTLIPSVFLVLFEITCMVTGGNKDERWWCWAYAWIIAAFIMIYCLFIIIISFTSLFTYNNAINKVEMNENHNKMSPQNSNEYAKAMIETTATLEKFNSNEVITTPEPTEPKEKKEENFGTFETIMDNILPNGKNTEKFGTIMDNISPNEKKTEKFGPFETIMDNILPNGKKTEKFGPFETIMDNILPNEKKTEKFETMMEKKEPKKAMPAIVHDTQGANLTNGIEAFGGSMNYAEL